MLKAELWRTTGKSFSDAQIRTLDFAVLDPRARQPAYRLCAEYKLASWRIRRISIEGREVAI